jgi:lysophospholipid acyltransferase (LPLAT)-like uncharacterized protein
MMQIRARDLAPYLWGRLIARYSRSVVVPSRLEIVDELNYPDCPVIFAGWHASNLVGLALHLTHRPVPRGIAFAPTGWTGAVLDGWLAGIGGMEAVHLPSYEPTGARAALRSMALAIRQGAYAVVAVDGPHGPAGVVRPGAIWLARYTEVPIVPVGFAAWPAVRFPRWDRLIVPLPGARVVFVVGKPFLVGLREPVDRAATDRLGSVLDGVNDRAWSMTGGSPSYRARSATELEGEAWKTARYPRGSELS